MGIQSAVMAEQFGTMFQYGKRRISAMSNEEFNKLTPEMLQERMTTQLKGMIPQMKEQIQAMSDLVPIIIEEFGRYINLAIKAIPQTADAILSPVPNEPLPTIPLVPSPETTVQCPAGSHWDQTRGTCVPDDAHTYTERHTEDCPSIQARAQKIYSDIQIRYDEYIQNLSASQSENASGADKAVYIQQAEQAKIQFTILSNEFNEFVNAHKTCLDGWSPTF